MFDFLFLYFYKAVFMLSLCLGLGKHGFFWLTGFGRNKPSWNLETQMLPSEV